MTEFCSARTARQNENEIYSINLSSPVKDEKKEKK